ncbi:MAG: type VI secretion system lipoprotein TssJ [Solidesulfovibrio sp. DCME]|uniref:type VI secretion system lipoprotein TssJ n=1 Tax=Solidesulfovibrio sp. DCME TaxID=3447380 RepID=UPI003D0BFAAC
MKRRLYCLLLAAMAVSLTCCGGSPPNPKLSEPQWVYEPGAVKLRYRADKKLNEYDGEGHTVALCVYQLTQPNAFNTLAKSSEGLLKLLECKTFDATVVSYENIFVEPGQDKVTHMDRAENATYLGVVAGYNELNPQQSTRLFKYPVEEKTEGFFTTTTIRQPGKIFINLFLGPFGVQKVGSQ